MKENKMCVNFDSYMTLASYFSSNVVRTYTIERVHLRRGQQEKFTGKSLAF